MKKITLLFLGCLAGLQFAKAQSFSDDFESYTVGSKLGSQSPNWTTWSAADGGTEDVNVITTDNHTSGGSKSIYCVSTSTAGGPADVVLPFGGVQTSGIFTFSSWFKVPAGKTGYFNFIGSATINAAGTGNIYALDCFMNADGSIYFNNSATTKLITTYPQGVWYELKIVANLTTNNWEVFIDGVSKGAFASTENKVSFLDIYPSNAQASFWVDDVHYDIAPYTLPPVNGSVSSLVVANGLSGQQQTPSVIVKNVGSNAITSFNLTFNNNGATTTQTITGVNIASLTSYTVAIPAVTLASGTNSFVATISNVNGAGPDASASDDAKSVSFNAVTPAAGKMVVAEEGTGTWCGWCPRGAVFMDALATKYNGYFAGIAVHNGTNDPMKDATYDTGMGSLISGYPSALVDRGSETDPSDIEPDFLSKVAIAPKAFIANTSIYNAATRQLSVTITTTVQQAISGDYRLACVLTEDDVTGTTSGYNQANYYAGGSSGQMGGFETLANPVPAAQMHYNHVARAINPSFTGIPNAYGASATIGQVFTHIFTFTLAATWDASQMNIVGMFIDSNGKIDNASSSKISGAVGINEVNSSDVQFSLFPNPATNNAAISLNLEKKSAVEVAIYSVNGALIAEKNYGKLSGETVLPIELTNVKAGMYFVNLTIDGKTIVKKLIKE